MTNSAKSGKIKFTQEILEFLDKQLKEKPRLSYSCLADIIFQKFGVSISKASISKRAKVLNIERSRGRRRFVPVSRRPAHSAFLDCAGAFFLKGAELETGLLDTVNQLFKIDVENPQARKALRLAQRINAFLLYCSLFGLHAEREIAAYRQRGLLHLAEEAVVPSQDEIVQYLQYLTDQKLLLSITKEVTKNCSEALFISIGYGGKTFYLDAQTRTVWPNTKIPKFFTTTINTAKSCVDNAFIAPSAQYPLILQTAPGYTFLPSEVFSLIRCFEGAKKDIMARVVIMNEKEEELTSWQNLKPSKKGYFIFPLSPWQYERLHKTKVLQDFRQYCIGPRRENMGIADAKINLYDSQANENIGLRAALIKRENENIALVTNISRREERYIRKIAERYFSRWPDEKIKTFYDLMEEGHEEATKRSQSQLKLETLLAGSEKKSAQEVFRLFVEFLHRYAKNRFFPSELEKESLKSMQEKIYTQAGFLRIKKNCWEIILQPFAEEDFENICQIACKKFNQCGLKLHNKKNLHIYLQSKG